MAVVIGFLASFNLQFIYMFYGRSMAVVIAVLQQLALQNEVKVPYYNVPGMIEMNYNSDYSINN